MPGLIDPYYEYYLTVTERGQNPRLRALRLTGFRWSFGEFGGVRGLFMGFHGGSDTREHHVKQNF